MSRRSRHLADPGWSDQVEIVHGDAENRDHIAGAMRGVGVAYFLIHALGAGTHFESRDRTNALNFAAVARAC